VGEGHVRGWGQKGGTLRENVEKEEEGGGWTTDQHEGGSRGCTPRLDSFGSSKKESTLGEEAMGVPKRFVLVLSGSRAGEEGQQPKKERKTNAQSGAHTWGDQRAEGAKPNQGDP